MALRVAAFQASLAGEPAITRIKRYGTLTGINSAIWMQRVDCQIQRILDVHGRDRGESHFQLSSGGTDRRKQSRAYRSEHADDEQRT